jgi:hypothetical protein
MSEFPLNSLFNNPAGRRKITYTPTDLERTPLLTIVCGMKGVGKTWQGVKDIDRYVIDNPRTGKRGRKVLILDFNNEESYQKYKAVLPKYIKTLTEPRARRIPPFDEQGKGYDLDKMKAVAEYAIFNFKNGLLVLEDIDKYMTGAKGKSLIGAMTTNRHSGMDLLITHQSVSKVTQTEWQNAAFVRLHHQLDDVDRISDALPNYPLMKIAQIIVDRRYYEAVRQYKELGAIDEDEFKKRRSFFVYIDMLEHKIIGGTPEEFRVAAMEFIRQNPRLISKRMKVGDINGRTLAKEDAMRSLFNDYAHFYEKR